MSLIPHENWMDFSNNFENLFSFPRLAREENEGIFSPRVNAKELDKSYEITADLPGVSKDNLTVKLEDSVLTIEAKIKEDKTEKEDGKVISRERKRGSFLRRFNLGADIKESEIDATFEDGVLMLTVPKKEPKATQVKRIEIH